MNKRKQDGNTWKIYSLARERGKGERVFKAKGLLAKEISMDANC